MMTMNHTVLYKVIYKKNYESYEKKPQVYIGYRYKTYWCKSIGISQFPIEYIRFRAFEKYQNGNVCEPYPAWIRDECCQFQLHILHDTPYIKWFMKYHPDRDALNLDFF